jgi:hypothetical protein
MLVYLHPEHFEAAVNAGKHIYCEKPAATDVSGVRRVMRAGQKADPAKIVQFGFQHPHLHTGTHGLRIPPRGHMGRDAEDGIGRGRNQFGFRNPKVCFA